MPTLIWAALAGIALGLVYAASPLFVLTLAGAAALLATAGRDLPRAERRRLVWILGAALAMRFVMAAGLLLSNIPVLSDLGVGGLSGDDAYYLARAIRGRDIVLGLTHGRYDYFVVSDDYGRTSYIQLLTLMQVLFGPTPYGVRAFNALLFVSGAYLLFRMCRPGFGATASALSLTALLFMPSLAVSSISAAKEPAYFFVTTVLLTAALAIVRNPSVAVRAAAVLTVAVCLWVLDDLRRGALALGAAGLALAFGARVIFENQRRALIGCTAAGVVLAALLTLPAVQERVLDATASVAKLHAGHVFTSGHAYKLLDEGFYMHPGTPAAWPLELTALQAGRFLVRAVVSFLVTPLPWEMASLSELAFLPEHVVWMVMMVLLPIGIVAAWRRDATVTACLIGFALPTATAVAVTTGNVGTLLRLRGLVTPYIIWCSVIGGLTVCEWLLMRSPARVAGPAEAAL